MKTFNNTITLSPEARKIYHVIRHQVLISNAFCCDTLTEFLPFIRAHPVCRHEVKYLAGRIRSAVHAYDIMIANATGHDTSFFDAAMDEMYRAIQPRIQSLHKQIAAVCEHANLPDAELIARLEVCCILADQAKQIYLISREDAIHHGVNFQVWDSLTAQLQLTDIHQLLFRLADKVMPASARDINLNRYKRITHNVERIINTIYDAKLLNKALKKAEDER